jgi:lysophospholipase L1-like esterase
MITARLAAVAVGAVVMLSACTSAPTATPATSTPPVPHASTSKSAAPIAPRAKNTGNLYVSIGDSYAAGFQPTGRGQGHTTRNGFAYQAVRLAAKKGYHLRLVNFGCAGATTASVLHSPGCVTHYLGPGAPNYHQTQADAAVAFVKAHRGQVALITVSIGGNDVTHCQTAANVVSCVTSALAVIRHNLGRLVTRLRSAAGPTTTIVGTTYPDIFLGRALSPDATDQRIANLSILGFRGLINPALQSVYAAVHGKFADVTAATGAYVPLHKTTRLAPYGTVPVAVADICRLTYFCQYEDIHPRTAGYAIIARLVVGMLPER